MERIVVGADGSAGSEDALRWAAHIARRTRSEIVVMTGFEPADAEVSPRRYEELLNAQQARVEAWAQVADSGELAVRAVVERGDPRPGILQVAEREEAGLVVVGRVGLSAGPGLLHLGSMAEWLAHNAALPLAVVGGAVEFPIRGVLVGVDGSSGSRAAVRFVREISTGDALQVVAASVDQPYLEWTPATSPKNWRRGLERTIVDDFAADLTSSGIEVTALALRESNVADALLGAAKDQRSDTVVVGARGLGGFTGLRVGGVAIKTLHRADRPVVIIPSR